MRHMMILLPIWNAPVLRHPTDCLTNGSARTGAALASGLNPQDPRLEIFDAAPPYPLVSATIQPAFRGDQNRDAATACLIPTEPIERKSAVCS
jgi:hypothetical protein